MFKAIALMTLGTVLALQSMAAGRGGVGAPSPTSVLGRPSTADHRRPGRASC
jgi:hypothetical protein